MCNKNQAVEILERVFCECKKIIPAVTSAYLYGSYARGDYSSESDVDIFLLVNLEQEEISKYRMAMASITSDLSLEYDVTVSVTMKSEKHFNKYISVLPFYQNVVKEGVKYA